VEEVVDVTRRYTRKWSEVRTRRNEVTEEWLLLNLERLNQTKLKQISNPDVYVTIDKSFNNFVRVIQFVYFRGDQ
jgi:hypothetical protein